MKCNFRGGVNESWPSFIPQMHQALHLQRGQRVNFFLHSFSRHLQSAPDMVAETWFPPPWSFHMTEDTCCDQHPGPSHCQKDALCSAPVHLHPVCFIKRMVALGLGRPWCKMKQARREQPKVSCEHRISISSRTCIYFISTRLPKSDNH